MRFLQTFILLILGFYVNCERSSLIAQFRLQEKINIKNKVGSELFSKRVGWPDDLHEDVKKLNEVAPCIDRNKCRDEQEIKDLAYCKASKIQAILPAGYSLYYVMTQYKTESENEWSKFVYSHVGPDENVDKAVFLRICVPVDVTRDAWADDRCPLDDCTDMEPDFDQGKCKKLKME